MLLTAKRSRVELPSKAVDLLQEDSSVFSELVSQAGATLPASGSPVQLRELLSILLSQFFCCGLMSSWYISTQCDGMLSSHAVC